MGVGEWRPCDDRARRCAAAGASQDVEMGCGGLTCGTPTVEEPRWPIRRARGRNTESVVCAPRGGGLWKREGDDGRLGAGPRADGEKGGGGANPKTSCFERFGAAYYEPGEARVVERGAGAATAFDLAVAERGRLICGVGVWGESQVGFPKNWVWW